MTDRCVVPGCPNEIVRVMAHKDEPRVRLCICQFHAQVAMKYMRDDQLGRFVFGYDPAADGPNGG